MKGYTQINVIYTYRPANQYDSDSSMTNKVHDTNLMLLVFLDLKKVGNISFKTMCQSHETVDPYLKKFTF